MSVWFTVICNSFSLIHRSFLSHAAIRYYFLPKELQAAFMLKSCSNSDAGLALPVSITIRTTFQHPAAEWGLEIHNRAHLAGKNCRLLFRFHFVLCFAWNAFLEKCSWVTVMASAKAALNVAIGVDKHVNRSLAEQEDCTIQAQPMNLHTPGSTVHLTCRRRRRSSRFNCSLFFSFWHPAITLAPCGEQKGHTKAFLLAPV